MLGHGEEIGQDLCGVGFIGEAVPDGDAGITRQFFHRCLGKPAVLDAIEHPSQHTRGILHGLFDADLGTRGSQIGHMGTLVVGRRLEGATGTRGRLFENKGDVPAPEALHLRTRFLGLLEVPCQGQEITEFFRTKIQQLQETAVFQCVFHY